MFQCFYLVWNPDGPYGGHPTCRHESLESAKREAERLARLNPGQLFHVLVSVGTCHKTDVAWDEHQQPCDLPF